MTDGRCPVCGSARTATITDTGEVPVFCNQLCRTKGDAVGARKAIIRLSYCDECGHVYNSLFEASLVKYSPEYENSLHFSGHFQKYATALAAELTHRYGLHGKRIVEIGCGRGDFLATLCQGGRNVGFGFDISYPPDEPPATGSISISPTTYGELQGALVPDLVCMRHVLEHVAEPTKFLEHLRSSLPEGVPIYVEVPNVLYTLRDGGVWDLVYEHCHYFSKSSLQTALQMAGFRVTLVREVFDGQFLAAHAVTDRVGGVARPEPELEPLARNFAIVHGLKISQWRASLEELTLARRRVVAWGAGSKGSTFANLIAGDESVPYVVDVNPRKHGMFVAGTGARIVPPEFLAEYRPDVVVVLNPTYEQEIRVQLGKLGVEAELRVA
jgi:2-polyprenyl-3-methyl-5-hydroxy-6-metoxy-1,4-benzoquinol methylase